MADPRRPSVSLERLREFRVADRQCKRSPTEANIKLRDEALVCAVQNHTMVVETAKDVKTVKVLAKLGWKGKVEVRGNMKLAAMVRSNGLVLQES